MGDDDDDKDENDDEVGGRDTDEECQVVINAIDCLNLQGQAIHTQQELSLPKLLTYIQEPSQKKQAAACKTPGASSSGKGEQKLRAGLYVGISTDSVSMNHPQESHMFNNGRTVSPPSMSH